MEEAEWRQSAASLHDGLGAMLSVVKMYMQQIDANGNKEDLIEIKEESIQFLEESIRIIREQFYCLFPVSLERFGLLAALEDFAEREKEKTGMDIKVVGDDYRRFTSQKEMGLFRIVQGLYKFSREKMQASSVIIRICQKNGYFHVYYKRQWHRLF
jgi:signal transduction histidine kinase